EKWLQNLGILLHALKVEALETRETHGIFGVVEEKAKLPASCPSLEFQGQTAWQGIRQHTEGAKLRLNAIEILDLSIDFLLFLKREPFTAVVVRKNLHEQRQEVEIWLGLWQTKRIDLEGGAVRPDFD